MSHDSPAPASQQVLDHLQTAIVEAKRIDRFAAVVVVTALGVRRVRLELGRRMAMVNVRILAPDQVVDPFVAGESVIVVGPVPPEIIEVISRQTYVHIPVSETCNLDGVRIVSCPDAAVECRVAVYALLAARRRGVPWSSMVVAAASSGSMPMLVAALSRAGIPFFRSRGRLLSQSAAARFVVGALRASVSRWTRGAVSALWSRLTSLLDHADRHRPHDRQDR